MLLVTAWRFASWPTSRSPVLVKATTLGTVRPPSAEAMTVGSPPSITATTLFVVPRSMPMILAICVVSPVVGSRLVRVGFALGGSVELLGPVGGRCFPGRGVGVGVRGHGHEGRPHDAVAEAVPAADLLHDVAVVAASARHRRDRLVLARVERAARRGVDLADALALEQCPELPIDRGHALDPGIAGQLGWLGLDRPVEVVGEHQDLADEVLAREAEHRLALLAGPAPVVRELRPLPLEPGEVLVGLLLDGVALALQRVDVGEQLRRRDVDLVGALLRPRAMAHAAPPRNGVVNEVMPGCGRPARSSGPRRIGRSRSPGGRTSASDPARRP